jgi:hypothetical protein
MLILFLGAAIWRTGADWHATISQGYAFRLGTLGSVISGHWPEAYARVIEAVRRSAVPFVWDPVGAFVMSVPLALLFIALAGTVWLARPRERAR